MSHPNANRASGCVVALLCSAAIACSDNPASPHVAPSHTVAVSYCAALAPSWVAFRDGDGPWTRELPAVVGLTTTFSHAFASNHGAIASLTPIFGTELTVFQVLYGTPDELTAQDATTSADCITSNFRTLRGSVAGVDSAGSAFIVIGNTARTFVAPRFEPRLDFSIDGVAPGPQDLLASRLAPGSTPRLIIRRNLDLPNGSVMPTLDFTSSEAFDLVQATLTIQNADANAAVNLARLRTVHGETSFPVTTGNAGSTQPYLALPANRVLAGELEHLQISSNGVTTRTADVYFSAPNDRTVTLGDHVLPPDISPIAGTATPRLRAHYLPQADYDMLSSIVYQQATRSNFVVVSMTPAYAALVGGYDLDVPDLTGVPGFDPGWGLRSGFVGWTAIRSGGTLPLGPDAIPFEGAIRRTSTTAGSLTMP